MHMLYQHSIRQLLLLPSACIGLPPRPVAVPAVRLKVLELNVPCLLDGEQIWDGIGWQASQCMAASMVQREHLQQRALSHGVSAAVWQPDSLTMK